MVHAADIIIKLIIIIIIIIIIMAITATPGLEEGAEGELVPAAEARLQLRERDRRRHLRRGATTIKN